MYATGTNVPIDHLLYRLRASITEAINTVVYADADYVFRSPMDASRSRSTGDFEHAATKLLSHKRNRHRAVRVLRPAVGGSDRRIRSRLWKSRGCAMHRGSRWWIWRCRHGGGIRRVGSGDACRDWRHRGCGGAGVISPLRLAELLLQFFDFDAARVNERAQLHVAADETVDVLRLTRRELLHRFLQMKFRQNISAVQIFEISNRMVTSVFDLILNKHKYSQFLNTYRHQFLTYLTEWRRFFTLATTPTKSVVNNGPGPVSPWSLYIGQLWPTKYCNSYNHNSAVP